MYCDSLCIQCSAVFSGTEESKADEEQGDESPVDVKGSVDAATDLSKESDHPKDDGGRKQPHERVDPYGSWTTVRVW